MNKILRIGRHESNQTKLYSTYNDIYLVKTTHIPIDGTRIGWIHFTELTFDVKETQFGFLST